MSVGEVRRLLGFEDTDQTIDFLAAYNIGVESNGQVDMLCCSFVFFRDCDVAIA